MIDIFIDLKTMTEDIVDLVTVLRREIPDFDVVIGIPRGGMMIAPFIAEVYGKPLTTIDKFIEDEYWWRTGSNRLYPAEESKRAEVGADITIPKFKTALIVEDTVSSGNHMKSFLKQLKKAKPDVEYKVVALYTTEVAEKLCDLYCKKISFTHLMETNLSIYSRAAPPHLIAMDMDGVLCEDCPIEIARDDAKYEEWISTVKPYLNFHFKIDYIVSARLEKYREVTEKWLKEHGVKYDKLILQDANGRMSTDHARFKAEVLKKLPDGINYYESNTDQASKIYHLTGIQTLAVDNMVMYGQRNPSYEYHPIFSTLNKRMKVEVPIENVTNRKVPHKPTWLFPKPN